MAFARIGRQTIVYGDSFAYLVEVDRDDVLPFSCSTVRWASPSFEEGVLAFDFASDADEVHALAVEVDAGRRTLWDARTESRAMELFLDTYASTWAEVQGLGEADDAVELQLLHEVASGGLDIWTDDGLRVEREDDDGLPAKAAAAIEGALPQWAKVVQLDLGGAGTGYTAAAIALESGRPMQDLAAHLVAVSASRGGELDVASARPTAGPLVCLANQAAKHD